MFAFYEQNFPISTRVIRGIENSLTRSQNIDEFEKAKLSFKLSSVKSAIENRVKELKSRKKHIFKLSDIK